MRAELKRLNEQITRLTPAIVADELAGKVSIEFQNEVHGEIMAKKHEGTVYLFANNLDLRWRSGRAIIELEGLKKGTRIEVIDEHRQISADEGKFSDQFEPLGVHIYRIAL
jgi:hypothetical protein